MAARGTRARAGLLAQLRFRDRVCAPASSLVGVPVMILLLLFLWWLPLVFCHFGVFICCLCYRLPLGFCSMRRGFRCVAFTLGGYSRLVCE